MTIRSPLEQLAELAEGPVTIRFNPHLAGRETIPRYLSRVLDMSLVGLPPKLQQVVSEVVDANQLVECEIRYKGMLSITERACSDTLVIARMLGLLNRMQAKRANNGS